MKIYKLTEEQLQDLINMVSGCGCCADTWSGSELFQNELAQYEIEDSE